MKRFLLALAAVAAITIGSSFTNSAMAQGPGFGHRHGYGHHHGVVVVPRYSAGYGGYGYGAYRPGYNAYRPGFGHGGICRPNYGYGNPGYGGYGYRSGGVIQLYGPRGGFSFGF